MQWKPSKSRKMCIFGWTTTKENIQWGQTAAVWINNSFPWVGLSSHAMETFKVEKYMQFWMDNSERKYTIGTDFEYLDKRKLLSVSRAIQPSCGNLQSWEKCAFWMDNSKRKYTIGTDCGCLAKKNPFCELGYLAMQWKPSKSRNMCIFGWTTSKENIQWWQTAAVWINDSFPWVGLSSHAMETFKVEKYVQFWMDNSESKYTIWTDCGCLDKKIPSNEATNHAKETFKAKELWYYLMAKNKNNAQTDEEERVGSWNKKRNRGKGMDIV